MLSSKENLAFHPSLLIFFVESNILGLSPGQPADFLSLTTLGLTFNVLHIILSESFTVIHSLDPRLKILLSNFLFLIYIIKSTTQSLTCKYVFFCIPLQEFLSFFCF